MSKLFADTESCEQCIEHFFVVNSTGDLSKGGKRLSQVTCNQLYGLILLELGRCSRQRTARLRQGMSMPGVDRDDGLARFGAKAISDLGEVDAQLVDSCSGERRYPHEGEEIRRGTLGREVAFVQDGDGVVRAQKLRQMGGEHGQGAR